MWVRLRYMKLKRFKAKITISNLNATTRCKNSFLKMFKKSWEGGDPDLSPPLGSLILPRKSVKQDYFVPKVDTLYIMRVSADCWYILSIYQSVYLSIYLPIFIYLSPYIYLSIYLLSNLSVFSVENLGQGCRTRF